MFTKKESMSDSEEMKGRRIKVDKLQLNRETVRDLTPEKVTGGFIALGLPLPDWRRRPASEPSYRGKFDNLRLPHARLTLDRRVIPNSTC